MKSTWIVSVGLALAAMAFVLHGLLSGREEPGDAALDRVARRLSAMERQGDRVAAELAELRGELAALAGQVRSFEPRASLREPVAVEGTMPSGEAAEEKRVLADLEALVTRLEAAAATPREALVVSRSPIPETREETERIVGENQTIALDASRSVPERLQALRSLRARDGRSLEVALAMIQLLQDPSLDPRLRADITRNLDGVAFEELKLPLPDILQRDADSETREEAIETLQAFYDDPVVHAAVVQARDHDQDARVRLEAMRRLAEYEARDER